jgi:hypothetical protein
MTASFPCLQTNPLHAGPATGSALFFCARYQDLFAQWKDADPDLPLLKQAKAEYAKLP